MLGIKFFILFNLNSDKNNGFIKTGRVLNFKNLNNCLPDKNIDMI